MHSAAQVVPILKLLAEVELTEAQRQQVTAKFAATLDAVPANDRIYGAAARMKEGSLPAAAAGFNALVEKVDPVAAVHKPITEEESKPLKDEGTFDPKMFWRSKRSKEVLNALNWLKHGNHDLPDNQRFGTLEERSSKEWDAHYHDL
jgi:hypothetical protein